MPGEYRIPVFAVENCIGVIIIAGRGFSACLLSGSVIRAQDDFFSGSRDPVSVTFFGEVESMFCYLYYKKQERGRF
jgi:hypothetical protein